MRDVIASAQFKRDLKRMKKRGKDLEKLWDAVELLATDEDLPVVYQDHALIGNWRGYRDLHVEPDWLLFYFKQDNDLTLTRTGTHSDLT